MGKMIKAIAIYWDKFKQYYLPRFFAPVDFLRFLGKKLFGFPKIFTKKDARKILFVTDNFRLEIYRQAKWLNRNHGYKITLITPLRSIPELFPREVFENIYYFRNSWDLKIHLRELEREGYCLIHGFANPNVATHHAMINTSLPVIHCSKDLSVTYYGPYPSKNYLKRDIGHEKFSLSNANGVIGESLEIVNAYRSYGINRLSPALYFAHYCDHDYFYDNSKNLDPDNIHIVYVGGVYGSNRDPRHFGAMQFHWLIKSLSQQKIHFHIYPTVKLAKAHYDEYFNLAIKDPFFHFHQPVHPEALNRELNKYHFGIIPFFNEDTERSDNKRIYGSALKLFNFFEAQIPVLISKDVKFQNCIAKRAGGGIPVEKRDLHQLKAFIKSLNYPEILKNLQEGREKFSLKHNIHRISDFYSKITGNK